MSEDPNHNFRELVEAQLMFNQLTELAESLSSAIAKKSYADTTGTMVVDVSDLDPLCAMLDSVIGNIKAKRADKHRYTHYVDENGHVVPAPLVKVVEHGS